MTQEDYWAGVERLKARLWRLARLLLDSDADATDILDEAVFRGWQSCGQLRHPEYFDTWLTRILINECSRELRRRGREQPTDQLPETSWEEPDYLPLREAVARLPDKLRWVILLRYFSDYTLEETARALNLPRSTVHARQKKALELLKPDLT